MTKDERRVLECVKVWMGLKCYNEEFFRSFITGEGFKPEFLARKFAVDMDHSSLLRRLLAGEEPKTWAEYEQWKKDAA